MSIEEWYDDVLLVELPGEPDDMDKELEKVRKEVLEKGPLSCDVLIDFSNVDIIMVDSREELRLLGQFLHARKRRIVCYSIKPATKYIFKVALRDDLFEFVDDEFVAKASLQMGSPNVEKSSSFDMESSLRACVKSGHLSSCQPI